MEAISKAVRLPETGSKNPITALNFPKGNSVRRNGTMSFSSADCAFLAHHRRWHASTVRTAVGHFSIRAVRSVAPSASTLPLTSNESGRTSTKHSGTLCAFSGRRTRKIGKICTEYRNSDARPAPKGCVSREINY